LDRCYGTCGESLSRLPLVDISPANGTKDYAPRLLPDPDASSLYPPRLLPDPDASSLCSPAVSKSSKSPAEGGGEGEEEEEAASRFAMASSAGGTVASAVGATLRALGYEPQNMYCEICFRSSGGVLKWTRRPHTCSTVSFGNHI
jgi:hypothetical protein